MPRAGRLLQTDGYRHRWFGPERTGRAPATLASLPRPPPMTGSLAA